MAKIMNPNLNTVVSNASSFLWINFAYNFLDIFFFFFGVLNHILWISMETGSDKNPSPISEMSQNYCNGETGFK